MTSPAIELCGLSRSYRRRPALEGVDLTVGSGELMAVLGPNDSGKSTLVAICAGLDRPDSGAVTVLGVDPAGAGRDWRARIGLVADRSDDLSALTVLEAIDTVSALFSRARPARELIDAMALGAVRNTRCGRLSSDDRRRLDIALGIVGYPEVLLLDEPTTGFEADTRREFWSLLRAINEEGVTILLTTHYVDEAEFLADRVAVIAAGRVLEVGAPATIGGRGEAAVTVRWLAPDGPQACRTTEPTNLIKELSARFAGEIPLLTVERPTLQEAYARMIERANVARTESSARREEG